MKKKLVALMLAAAMTVPNLGVVTASAKGEAINDLVTYVKANREMANPIMINSEGSADSEIICNVWEGFLEMNEKGQLKEAMADEWGTEDGGLTWTFHIRDGVKWVDADGNEKADHVANDYVVALEYVLNYWKNGGNNTTMPNETIVGAEEYYEYTKGLTEEEGQALGTEKFLEMVGIETPDDYTVTYHCIRNCTYFDSLAVAGCLYPISSALLEEVGVEGLLELDADEIWYNGAYRITDYTKGNEIVMEKNESYWDTECSLFDSVTYLIVDDDSIAYQLYQNGEIDRVDLPTSTLKSIYEDEGHEYHDELVETRMGKSAFSIHWNYVKMNEDGTPDENWNTAIANENFRKAFYYGTDWTPFFESVNFITPMSCELTTYTIPGLLYFSDGTDYTERVKEILGVETKEDAPANYNAELGQEYKEKAMEELEAQGVTFPVEMVYHVKAGDQQSEDQGTIIKQLLTEGLGEDFITVTLDTYVSSWTSEAIDPQLQCFAINGWGADYADAKNFLGQEVYGSDNAMYSRGWSNVNDCTDETLIALYEEYTAMVDAADEITDIDERYEAFAQAEAFMIEHCLTMPLYAKVNWQLTKINDYTKPYSAYGTVGAKFKNVESSVDAYTTAEYEESKKALFAE